MKIILNGKEKETAVNTIENLIKELPVNPRNVVIEVNGGIIHKDKYKEFSLNENDQVEIVQFVGGG